MAIAGTGGQELIDLVDQATGHSRQSRIGVLEEVGPTLAATCDKADGLSTGAVAG